MAPREAGDLSARIRSDVERGRPRDEIVAGLVQGGLSKPSAERFVDRAMAARDAGPPPPPATAPAASESDAAEDPGGRGSLIAGAFWLSLGCSVTGITYLLAKPGGKYMLAYGAVVAGLRTRPQAILGRRPCALPLESRSDRRPRARGRDGRSRGIRQRAGGQPSRGRAASRRRRA